MTNPIDKQASLASKVMICLATALLGYVCYQVGAMVRSNHNRINRIEAELFAEEAHQE